MVGILRPPKVGLIATQMYHHRIKARLQADKTDLKALLSANEFEDSRYQYRQRLSFVMSEARIGKLLKAMDDPVL